MIYQVDQCFLPLTNTNCHVKLACQRRPHCKHDAGFIFNNKDTYHFRGSTRAIRFWGFGILQKRVHDCACSSL
jgi:hypothetical protein